LAGLGAFTFVLHSHLPYVRLAGRWPHGEEWLHEAIVETYIPLLNILYDLKNEGIRYRLNIGLTPVLAEQLTDPLILQNLEAYLDTRIAAARADIGYFEQSEHYDPHLRYLASWYDGIFQGIKSSFQKRFNRDLIGAFKALQDEGYIEIVAGAATHAYLPLLSRDSAIHAQLKTGVRSYERMFGRKPRTVWLPECAYRPAIDDGAARRPGLERFLANLDLRAFYGESHAVMGGRPVVAGTANVVGGYSGVDPDYATTLAPTMERPTTPYEAYYVADTTVAGATGGSSGVAIIARNEKTGQQVWSADWGYPGDFDYREFHRKSDRGGLQYWRVSGKNVDLGEKDVYHPDWAAYKVDQHAEHYVHLVGDLIRSYAKKSEGYGLVMSSYDTELFGHWWFEGVSWLGKVLRYLTTDKNVDLVTTSEYLDTNTPRETLNVPESSWGAGGTHDVWDNADNHWMWQPIHDMEARIEALAKQHGAPDPDVRVVLNQAARESLLAQSSDWQFQVTSKQAADYATQRFNSHVERFDKLASSVENGKPDRALADELYELDKVFADIDYRWFGEIGES
jgi:1,4-alpha-glucan branching enzyme